MSAETIELANNYTQKRFVDLVRNNIVNGGSSLMRILILYGWHVTVQELIQRSKYTLRTSSNVLVLRINLIYQFCTHHFSSKLN